MKKVLSICAALVVCAAMSAQETQKLFLKLGEGWGEGTQKFSIYHFNSEIDNGWSDFMTLVEGDFVWI